VIQGVNNYHSITTSYKLKQCTETEKKDSGAAASNSTTWKEWRQTDGTNGRPPVFGICHHSMLFGPLHGSYSHLAYEIRDLHWSIVETLAQFHRGRVSQADVEELFEFAYETMVKVHTEVGFMDKADDPDDLKARILMQVLQNFQLHNGLGAISASLERGASIAETPQFQRDDEGRNVQQWAYYNAQFHFQEKELADFLNGFAIKFAEERGLVDPVKLMPPNYSFFRMLYTGLKGFPEDFSPPRDFSMFVDFKNERVVISGATINRQDVDNISHDELDEKLLELGIRSNHLSLIRFVNVFLYWHTGVVWFEPKDKASFVNDTRYLQMKDAYDVQSLYAYHNELIETSIKA